MFIFTLEFYHVAPTAFQCIPDIALYDFYFDQIELNWNELYEFKHPTPINYNANRMHEQHQTNLNLQTLFGLKRGKREIQRFFFWFYRKGLPMDLTFQNTKNMKFQLFKSSKTM